MTNRLQSTLQNLPTVAKLGMVLSVVFFISFLSPNNTTFKYQFELNETWRYGDLKAPFDFPIQKTKAEITEEKERIERDFSPYYEMDLDVVKAQKRQFQTAFDAQLAIAKRDNEFRDVQRHIRKYKDYGLRFLDRIYNQGIASIHSDHQAKSKDFVFNIIQGNTTRQETVQNLYSFDSASELLSDSLPYSGLYEPEFLLPLLNQSIRPNLVYSDSLSQRFKASQLDQLSSSRGMVRKGETIISKEETIKQAAYQKLVSFRDQYEQDVLGNTYFGVFSGYFLLSFLIIGIFIAYLYVHARPVYDRFSNLIFMLLWVVVFSYLVYIVERVDSLSSYLIPFCIVPIVLKNFFSERLALFTHIVIVLIASFLTSLGYEFTFLQILAGIVAMLAYTDTRDWSKFFFTILYIFLAYALAYLGLSLVKVGVLQNVNWSNYTWLIINAFLTLLAYPLIPLVERMFGFTSAITLAELSDLNRPLLRELSTKAPGTLQHSLQVANLCEAAANEIGANALLIKVAALYHDIGKTLKPEYFIENNPNTNLHEALSNFDSAKIIIGHALEGVTLAKKHRLPSVLIDFIKTHHGTTRVEYFYRKQLQDFPNQEFDESLFRYPGPRPRTKEETILMCADSLEAASKSLRNPTGQDIDQLVNKIIAGKVTNGQFEDSALTFNELERCIKVFKQLLRNINHVRIEYPEETA